MDNLNKTLKKVLLAASTLCLIILLISGFALLLQFDLIGSSSTAEEPRTEEEQRIINELPGDLFYTLPRRATTHQLEIFEPLFIAHNNFNETNTDSYLQAYAEMIARNFIADFFTFSNKSSRHDVGGLQFINAEIYDEFYDFAVNTFYLHLNQYLEIYGAHQLPSVATTTILHSEIGWHRLELTEYPWAEYLPVIIVDVEWAYAPTTLSDIDEFQTTARIILQEDDGEVKIRSIEDVPVAEQPSEILW